MPRSGSSGRWTRHFYYRREHTRTTWTLRLGLLAAAALVMWATSGCWAAAVGRSLVCEPDSRPSDAILVENFDNDYLVFERAAGLRRRGRAPLVLVPVWTGSGREQLSEAGLAVAEAMARVSRLGDFTPVPVRDVEPISLNVARDVLSFVQRQRIGSVTVVAPSFRSRRSELVYHRVFDPAGVAVRCEPARGPHNEESWTRSWHGIEVVGQQWVKLLYYRVYVLRRSTPQDQPWHAPPQDPILVR